VSASRMTETTAGHSVVSREDTEGMSPEWAPLNLEAVAAGEADVNSAPVPELAPEPPAEPTAAAVVEQEPEPILQAAATESVSFMRDAGRPSLWQRRGTQSILLGLATVLTAVMASQWVYQEHDRLAAARPHWKPAIVKMCAVLRCSIAPLQQIESIAIDSAAFSKVGPDRYRLSFVLKNGAFLALAVPSIELTLTDVQDRVVLRRVLSPQELAAVSDHLAANAEWPVSVNLRLNAELPAAAVVGYRVLAFYP